MLISPLSIAPMVDWSTSPFRVLMRHLAPRCLVYTDMQTTGAILHNPKRALHYEAIEHPIALQVGGSIEKELVLSVQKGQEQGFDEVNLNLGCPSSKVQAGAFGACLMAKPALVVRLVKAMKSVSSVPLSAKIRIGIDKTDSYDFFRQFAYQLIDAGCDKLIIHARKAWLSGLNPKQNRTIPPIQYDFVYRLKQELPTVPIVINGDIQTGAAVNEHLEQVDGVMIGRLACNNPYQIHLIHGLLFKEKILSRAEILAHYMDYVAMHQEVISLSQLLKPIFNMAHGLDNNKYWKGQLMAALKAKTIMPVYEGMEFIRSL